MPTLSRTKPSPFVKHEIREPTRQLNDTQWFLIEDLIADRSNANPFGGLPRHSSRNCFEGILFVLISGCHRKDLSDCFPSKSDCHQRFALWTQKKLFQIAWERLFELNKPIKQLNLSRLIGDGTFSAAKKGVATQRR